MGRLENNNYIQFIYDGKLGDFCKYFSFFKTLNVDDFIKEKNFNESKASKEELSKCFNYEAYLSFKYVIEILKENIKNLCRDY